MQKRFKFRSNIEVARLGHEYKIRNIASTRCNMLAQCLVFISQQYVPTCYQAKRKHCNQCWKNSFNSPTVKLQQAKSFTALCLENDPSNQIARNDEKNINSNKSAWQPARECMKDHYSNNCQRTQPVNVGAIRQVWVMDVTMRGRGANRHYYCGRLLLSVIVFQIVLLSN